MRESVDEIGGGRGDEGGTRLRRELGLMDGVSIIVGIVVGAGIFVSPKGVLLNTGSVGLALVVWAACGLITVAGALCYAELGTSIPESGGEYAYLSTAMGPLPAFLYQWSCLTAIYPAGNAIMALTLSNYALAPIWPDCPPPEWAVRLMAALVIAALTALNCKKVKAVASLQDLFTIVKMAALMLVVVTGLGHALLGHVVDGAEGKSDVEKLTMSYIFKDSVVEPARLALAFYSGLYSFAGWSCLNLVTEEIKNPVTNLPRAIYLSLPLVAVVYLLANVAYFTVLTPIELLSSDAVAVTFGNRVLPTWLAWVLPLSVVISSLGSLNGCIFASARIFFVGARRGHMPRCIAFINVDNLTPTPSLVFLSVTSLAMLAARDVYQLINLTSFIESLFMLLSVISMLILRRTQPHRHRPIRVSLVFPFLFLLSCLFLLVLPVFESPFVVAIDLGILLVGSILYLLFIRWQNKPKAFHNCMYAVDLAIQKVFMAVPEEW